MPKTLGGRFCRPSLRFPGLPNSALLNARAAKTGAGVSGCSSCVVSPIRVDFIREYSSCTANRELHYAHQSHQPRWTRFRRRVSTSIQALSQRAFARSALVKNNGYVLRYKKKGSHRHAMHQAEGLSAQSAVALTKCLLWQYECLLSVAGQTRLALGCAAPTGMVLPVAPVQPCLATGTSPTGGVFRSCNELPQAVAADPASTPLFWFHVNASSSSPNVESNCQSTYHTRTTS